MHMHLSVSVRSLLSMVCHQIPSRSFCGYWECLPLCQRCTGIYLGFAFASAYWRARACHLRILPGRPAVAFLVCALVLLSLDLVAPLAPESYGWDRLITGAFAGAGVAMVVSPLAFGEVGWECARPTTGSLTEVAILGTATLLATILASSTMRHAILLWSIALAALVGGAFVCLWAALLRGVGWAIGTTPPRRRSVAGVAAILTILQFTLTRLIRQS